METNQAVLLLGLLLLAAQFGSCASSWPSAPGLVPRRPRSVHGGVSGLVTGSMDARDGALASQQSLELGFGSRSAWRAPSGLDLILGADLDGNRRARSLCANLRQLGEIGHSCSALDLISALGISALANRSSHSW